MTIRLIIILFGINICFKALADSPDQRQLPIEWYKLIHVESIKGNTFKSLIKDKRFFLSSRGEYNLREEFELNKKAFLGNQEYPCKFPARAKFLSKYLAAPYSLCEKIESWKKDLGADGISYVLVGQYVSNPASAFGHSFFILKNSKKPFNLNMTLNYAAEVPQEINMLEYITKGFSGGFFGRFDIEPLYIKLQEYNAIENREIWSYDLTLTSYELDQFLNHLWELSQQTKENYYFLNNNCAVALYNMIAAVHPYLDFIKSTAIYVSPLESIRKISKISENQTYFPSQRESLVRKYNNLDLNEKDEFNQFINDKNLMFSSTSKKVIEVELDYFEFLKTKKQGVLSEQENINYEGLLLKRSKLGQRQNEEKIVSSNFPHWADKTWRLGLGASVAYQKINAIIKFSPASHHLLQRENGFVPNSEISFLDAKIIGTTNSAFYLEEFYLFRFKKFTYTTAFDPQFSWTASSAFEKEDPCASCFKQVSDANVGLSLGPQKHLGYLLVGLSNYRQSIFSPQLLFGSIFNLANVRGYIQLRHIEPIDLNYEKMNIVTVEFNKKITTDLDFEVTVTSDFKNSKTEGALSYYF